MGFLGFLSGGQSEVSLPSYEMGFIRDHPFVRTGVEGKILGFMSNDGKKVFEFSQLEEIADYIKLGETIEVPLNASQKATVSKSGITVGCQTFPLTVVAELAEAVKKLNP